MDTPAPQVYAIYPVTLKERREEFKDVFTYIFTSSESVPFEAGQYAHVRLLNMPEDVRRVREISFASAPQDSEIWFGIDSRSGSEYQKALQALEVGDTIELFKIKGHMSWPPATRNVVMIAGGVGITPFRSMLRDASQSGKELTTTLIHVARDSYLYDADSKELANEYHATNREELPSLLEDTVTKNADAQFYIAGSPEFVQGIVEMLSQKGITNIQSDEFKGLHGE